MTSKVKNTGDKSHDLLENLYELQSIVVMMMMMQSFKQVEYYSHRQLQILFLLFRRGIRMILEKKKVKNIGDKTDCIL